MSLKLPYFSSLNSQMAQYYKQIKMQEYNDTYQQAQLDIVLEGERNLASQAEIMNRLTQLQQEIANQAVQTLIPLSKTNAPTVETSKFPGMTASDYENIMIRKAEIDKNEVKNVLNNIINEIENNEVKDVLNNTIIKIEKTKNFTNNFVKDIFNDAIKKIESSKKIQKKTQKNYTIEKNEVKDILNKIIDELKITSKSEKPKASEKLPPIKTKLKKTKPKQTVPDNPELTVEKRGRGRPYKA